MKKTKKPAARARVARKTTPRRSAKRCAHTGRAVAILGVDVEAYACRKCDAVGVRPVGRSNDDSPDVQVEMRAAELDLWFTVDGLEERDLEVHEMTLDEYHGWARHIGPMYRDFGVHEDQHPGWLARELVTYDVAAVRDATAWAWDTSRPLAEQLAETTEWDAAADRIAAMDQRDAKQPAARDELAKRLLREIHDEDAAAEQLAETAADDAAADAMAVELLREIDNERAVAAGNSECGRKDLDAQAVREEARSAACTAALVADFNAKGPAYDAINDALDAEDADLQAGGPAMTMAEEVAVFVSAVTQTAEMLADLDPADFAALEYELTRDAEPDCRDEDGPEVERIMEDVDG